MSTLVKALYDVKQRSVVVKGELLLAPQVISLTPSQAAPEATVVDCSDDSHWLAYKLDGSIEDNTHGGQRHVEAIVENDRGVWRVTKLAVLSFRS